VKVCELVEATGISYGTVISILRKQEYEKVIGKIDAAFAHYETTSATVTISKQCLKMFQCNPDEFLRRFITVDETWIHYFTPETKEQSK